MKTAPHCVRDATVSTPHRSDSQPGQRGSRCAQAQCSARRRAVGRQAGAAGTATHHSVVANGDQVPVAHSDALHHHPLANLGAHAAEEDVEDLRALEQRQHNGRQLRAGEGRGAAAV